MDSLQVRATFLESRAGRTSTLQFFLSLEKFSKSLPSCTCAGLWYAGSVSETNLTGHGKAGQSGRIRHTPNTTRVFISAVYSLLTRMKGAHNSDNDT